MTQWGYVVAAYAVTLAGAAAVALASYLSMRRAEK